MHNNCFSSCVSVSFSTYFAGRPTGTNKLIISMKETGKCALPTRTQSKCVSKWFRSKRKETIITLLQLANFVWKNWTYSHHFSRNQQPHKSKCIMYIFILRILKIQPAVNEKNLYQHWNSVSWPNYAIKCIHPNSWWFYVIWYDDGFVIVEQLILQKKKSMLPQQIVSVINPRLSKWSEFHRIDFVIQEKIGADDFWYWWIIGYPF